ncbi:hypothetical protein [Nocardioides dongkuii]|uniref:hypothetical protein n=1 Tax=Nocardioides dongkuii TaxID=2760089 RepID=UPI0015FB959F|nr:hypothetical protein [Nocardioides dongkuii]
MTRRTTYRLTSAAAAAVLVGVLGACSSDDEGSAEDPASSPTPSATPSSAAPSTTESTAPESPSPSAKPAGPQLDVEVSGADVGPNAEEIELEVGEPLTLRFDSDRAGELHVHSRPEQYVEFGPGRSEQKLVIDSPGVVEVEEHESGVVIAVLRVGG